MSVSQKEKVETFKNFVNGKWKGASDGATFEDENPALRGSNIGLFPSSTPDDVREALDAADHAVRRFAADTPIALDMVRRVRHASQPGNHRSS